MLQIFAKKKKKGFTLIELLVVIAIIGTLASIVLVSMGGARKSARDAVRKADMRQLISAQEMYYGGNDAYYAVATYPATIADANNTYMAKTPLDPTNSGANVYTWVDNTSAGSGDQTFCVWVPLEGGKWYTATHAGNIQNTTAITGTTAALQLADCIDGD